MPVVRRGNWQGDAFDSYKLKTELQDDAATAASEKANKMADILDAAAAGGLTAYIAIAAAIVSLFFEEIVELVASCTGIAAPVSVPAAAASLIKALLFLGGITVALVNIIPVINTQLKDLEMNEQAAGTFVDGNWPSGTA
jgi:hypothetical protein